MANPVTETTNDIKDDMEHVEAKVNNIELVTSPENCLHLVNQGGCNFGPS